MKRYVIRFDPSDRTWDIIDKQKGWKIEGGYSKIRAYYAACHYNYYWKKGIPA